MSRVRISVRSALASCGAVMALAACSSGLTGGATSGLTPTVPAAPGGLTPQSAAQSSNAQTQVASGPGAPAPAVTSEVTVVASATPFPLPSTGGFTGTVAITAANPAASEEPVVDLKVEPQPSHAPVRPTTAKTRITNPLVQIELASSNGDTILGGIGAIALTLPSAAVSAMHHLVIGFFDLGAAASGSSHSLFGHHKGAGATLIDLDDKASFSKLGVVTSKHITPVTLQDGHRYTVVYYVDRLPTAATAPPMGPRAPGSLPGGAAGAGSLPGSPTGVGGSAAPMSTGSPLPGASPVSGAATGPTTQSSTTVGAPQTTTTNSPSGSLPFSLPTSSAAPANQTPTGASLP